MCRFIWYSCFERKMTVKLPENIMNTIIETNLSRIILQESLEVQSVNCM